MRILIDQDGTIANWGKTWDKTLALYGASDAIPRHADQRSFNLKDGLDKEDRAMVDRVMSTPGFYADLEPIDGAIDALNDMVAAGHDVAIVTSPYYSNPTCIEDKLTWVRRNLGREWLSRVILAGDKTRIAGDILIDDKTTITGSRPPVWEHVYFDQPYNQPGLEGVPLSRRRLYNWADWQEVVETLPMADWEKKLLDGGEVRTTSATGGQKGVKPQRYDLVPVEPLALLAELYGHGASKYAAHNWRRGYPWSNSYAAAMRHLTQFWNGEDIDPEMGTPHVINAAFHLFALAQFMKDFPEYDDRYKKEASK